MSLRSLRGILAVAMMTGAGIVSAADELVLYAFEDGAAATGLEVVVDGEQSEILDSSGSASFDLSAGRHSVAVLLGGVEVHRFNFSSAAGQLVDVSVSLQSGEDPQQFVESYFPTETARDRAAAPKGTLTGRLRNDGQALSGATVTVAKTCRAGTSTAPQAPRPISKKSSCWAPLTRQLLVSRSAFRST